MGSVARRLRRHLMAPDPGPKWSDIPSPLYLNGKPVEGLRGFRVLVDPDAEAKFTYADLTRAVRVLDANSVPREERWDDGEVKP